MRSFDFFSHHSSLYGSVGSNRIESDDVAFSYTADLHVNGVTGDLVDLQLN